MVDQVSGADQMSIVLSYLDSPATNNSPKLCDSQGRIYPGFGGVQQVRVEYVVVEVERYIMVPAERATDTSEPEGEPMPVPGPGRAEARTIVGRCEPAPGTLHRPLVPEGENTWNPRAADFTLGVRDASHFGSSQFGSSTRIVKQPLQVQVIPDGGPDANRDDGPDASRDDGPDANRDDGPDTNRDDGPDANRDDGPDATRDDGPDANRDEKPDARRDDGTNQRRARWADVGDDPDTGVEVRVFEVAEDCELKPWSSRRQRRRRSEAKEPDSRKHVERDALKESGATSSGARPSSKGGGRQQGSGRASRPLGPQPAPTTGRAAEPGMTASVPVDGETDVKASRYGIQDETGFKEKQKAAEHEQRMRDQIHRFRDPDARERVLNNLLQAMMRVTSSPADVLTRFGFREEMMRAIASRLAGEIKEWRKQVEEEEKMGISRYVPR
jgi:hypothetical protein